MIVTPTDGQFLVITQNDHAHFAGDLLSLWRSDGLPEHPRRRHLLFAAREHDNGWREADSAPRCRSDGRPHDFMTVPRELRWEIWRRGTRRFARREPHAALLILRHARELHRNHRADPAWAEVLAEWAELEAELMEATAADADAVTGDYRWIATADRLSLAVCNRWRGPFEAWGVAAEVGCAEIRDGLPDLVLALAPFPLAGTTTFGIACRPIEDRAYAADADLGVALASARWRRLAVRVTACGPPQEKKPGIGI